VRSEPLPVSPSRPSRRDYLAGAAAVVAAGLAGCSGSPEAGDDPGDGADEEGADETTAADATPAETTTSDDDDDDGSGSDDGDGLDLREANVVGVTIQRDAEEGVRFDVTLLHDDDGEDGYANWWQVETADGERLGRRELSHAHGTQEFTRSETVAVPAGVSTVVVRGHDQTHGYGGQAAVVDVENGDVGFVRQGPQRRAVAGSD